MAAIPALRHPLGLRSAANTTPQAMRLSNFAGGGESVIAACLIAAHCAMMRSEVRQSQPQQVYLCCCLQVLRCTRVGLQYLQSCPDVARVQIVRSTHRARFLCSASLQSACAMSTCVNFARQHISHVHAQALAGQLQGSACASALASVPHLLICVFAAIIRPHQRRGAQPSPPGCIKLSLEGLKVPTFAPLVVASPAIGA